jgi:hypothetical protein
MRVSTVKDWIPFAGLMEAMQHAPWLILPAIIAVRHRRAKLGQAAIVVA